MNAIIKENKAIIIETTLRDRLDHLKSLISAGLNSFTAAGEVVRDLVDSHACTLQTIHDHTGIPLDVLAQFERIGRGHLHPQLLIATYPAATALQRLPASVRDALLTEPTELLTLKDGQTDILLVHARNLTRDQVRQVFARNHVRSIDEQRAWLESERTAREQTVTRIDIPYAINHKRGCVTFRADVEVTEKELLRILTQLQD